MAVIQLPDNTLVLWSPVAITPTLRSAVDALGPVAHLVAPNALHHLALADWQAAYPAALLHHPPKLAAKRPDLRLDVPLTATPHPAWAKTIDQHLIDNAIAPEAVFFHRPSGTAIFTDLLQQLPPGWFSGWRALIARLDLITGTAPTVPRKFRMAISDRSAARVAIDTILACDVQRLVIAHGPPLDHDARGALERAFSWLR